MDFMAAGGYYHLERIPESSFDLNLFYDIFILIPSVPDLYQQEFLTKVNHIQNKEEIVNF